MALKDKEVMKLWDDAKLPFGEKTAAEDIPTLQAFLPDPAKANGRAVVVLPGGGYSGLAPHEGAPVAEWLVEAGYTAFVLLYRRGTNYPNPVPLTDAQRALRLVRSKAGEWGIAADKIGILGFSAGGHLASTAATHLTEPDPAAPDPVDRVSARPDFQILVYPVISMGEEGHAGSRLNLLGENPTPEQVQNFSNQTRITEKTPPAFLFHSTLDDVVLVANSDQYVAGLEKAGIPYRYVRGEYGGHGIGLNDCWTGDCLTWLETVV
ncbi:MAG: alpha/beta hydrolase [Chloroflexi bacterium]|nr:alpha/beta hydrolase [Chloroflexota bacterium]